MAQKVAAAALLVAACLVASVALFSGSASQTSEPITLFQELKSKTVLGYGNWLCHVGWREEGCGDSPRYLPGGLRAIQKDDFDLKYDNVFGGWEKSIQKQRKLSRMIPGCDGKLGSGKKFDSCGTCGGHDNSCSPRAGFKTEYWQFRFKGAKALPVLPTKPQRVWAERHGRLDLQGRAAFHTAKGDRFATRYSGMLDVGKEGLYGFTLTSVDASKLFIDGRLIVDNDKLHGRRSRSGVIALSNAMHEITVEYFCNRRRPYLKLEWQSETMAKTPVKLVLKPKQQLANPPRGTLPSLPRPRRRTVVRRRRRRRPARPTRMTSHMRYRTCRGGDWTTCACPSGFKVLTGGCNAYRYPFKWQFNGPSGNGWKCGGHGSPKTVHVLCTKDNKGCSWRSRVGGDWTTQTCPAGTQIASGGCNARNRGHVMRWNMFNGNGWRCGGWGTQKRTYALCCKRQRLQGCVTRRRVTGDWGVLSCPAGTRLVGGGCDSHRPWYIQVSRPLNSRTWQCGGHGGKKDIRIKCCSTSVKRKPRRRAWQKPQLRFGSRYSTQGTTRHTTLNQARAMWNRAKHAKGYCSRTVSRLVMKSNQNMCGRGGRRIRNIAYNMIARFSVRRTSKWQFRVGTDWGRGGVVGLDNKAIINSGRGRNIWWAYNWNRRGHVLYSKPQTLRRGRHALQLYGFENCCDGATTMQYRVGGSGWKDMTFSNLLRDTIARHVKKRGKRGRPGMAVTFWRFGGAVHRLPRPLQRPMGAWFDSRQFLNFHSAASFRLPKRERFAARYRGRAYATRSGTYTFYLRSDDGSKLYVDGKLRVNNDGLHGPRTRTARVTLWKGFHDIRVDFFQNGGGGFLRLMWRPPGTRSKALVRLFRPPKKSLPRLAKYGAQVSYWHYGHALRSLSQTGRGKPQKKWFDNRPFINLHGRGFRTPHQSRFATQMKTMVFAPRTGHYTFYLGSDDGSKLYLDNKLLVNNDGLHGLRYHAGRRRLKKGMHAVRINFFQNGGGANLVLQWAGPGIRRQLAPVMTRGPNGKCGRVCRMLYRASRHKRRLKRIGVKRSYLRKVRRSRKLRRKLKIRRKTIRVVRRSRAKARRVVKKKKCFPADALVALPGGGTVRMDALRHGDEVATVDESGRLAASQVFFFGHKLADASSPFACLRHERGGEVCMSGDHFVRAAASPAWAASAYARANKVAKGMWVWVQEQGTLVPARVTAVETKWKRGLYAPLTLEHAMVVVNGVASSTHSEWFLDAVTPASLEWALPHVYEKALWLGRTLYRLAADPLWAADVQERLGLVEVAHAHDGVAGALLPYYHLLGSELPTAVSKMAAAAARVLCTSRWS